MVSHFELPNGKFQVIDRYFDPLTGKRRKVTLTYSGNTRKAKRNAERALEDKIDEILNERTFDFKAKIRTFSDLSAEWFDHWSRGVTPRTVDREKLVLNRVNDLIDGDILVDKITPFLLEKLLADYQKKYDSSYSTMTHIKSTLNKIFRYAVKHGTIDNTPMAVVELHMSREKRLEPKIRREMKYLEPHEFNAFLSEMKKKMNQMYYYLTIFLVHSGARIGEAGAITKNDVNFDAATVNINKSLLHEKGTYSYGPTKTEKSIRTVALPPLALESLRAAMRLGDELERRNQTNPTKTFVQTESIFRSMNGAPVTSQAFREVIRRTQCTLRETCESEYGFKWEKNITPHSFRFINITYLKDSEGVDMKSVQAHVGHSDIRTTLGVYAQQSKKGEIKLVEAMEKWDDENSDLNFHPIYHFSHYSTKIENYLQPFLDVGRVELSLHEFRKILELNNNYTVRHITGNIIPRLLQDLNRSLTSFEIQKIYGSRNKIEGYLLLWEK